ncbi:unnamed protein product [Urochloa humidicola]
MGLDALPHGQAAAAAAGDDDATHSSAASPATLRRSASKRVPRDPSLQLRFIDRVFFECPASHLMQNPSLPLAAVQTAEAAMMWRAAPDLECPRSAAGGASGDNDGEILL